MQKTTPATTHSVSRSAYHASRAIGQPAPRQGNDLAQGVANLLGQFPAQQRLHAFNSVVNLASEAMHLYQAHLHTRETEANCRRDMHLSDNEVRQKVIALQEVVEREQTQREKNRQDHEYRMALSARQHEVFERKMQQAEALIELYRKTGDSQFLAAATQILIQLSEV